MIRNNILQLKQKISRLFWSTISSEEKVEYFQKIIRDKEWDDIEKYIPRNSKFLDIGCGSGYNLIKAKKELNCEVTGIDPHPGSHGVGRYNKGFKIKIKKGHSEFLPFNNESFDVVFCSHVLEHVSDEHKSLNEISRVVKKDGIIIIGMPTAVMSIILLLSKYFFTTHINILAFIKSVGKKNMFTFFLRIFIPNSHSYPRAKTVFYDLVMYRVKRWRKLISSTFKINYTISNHLYPYPDYIQPFKIHKSIFGGSSVFFICQKKD